jgi:diadenylate cyclase
MLEGLLHLFARRPLSQIVIDVLDIALVTWAVYRALLVLRGTRAMQMGTGLGVIFLVYVIAKWAGFITLYNLLSTLLSSIILIVVVVFQNDIRRGLMRVGARAFFGGIARQQESRVIDEVVAAVTELARHRMGALICFEQEANLDEFVVGQGTTIDAIVQRELLVGMFVPESVNKLHDGAVVIRNLRVAKAGVFFPMPDTRVLDKSLGSRHRAALGITEETDAVVVVVSEERGTISFCFNGNIVSNLDGASLRQALLGLFGQRTRNKKKGAERPKSRQSQTGSYRITLPQGELPPAERPLRDSAAPPASASAGAATGSLLVTPLQPKADQGTQLKTQPLQAAPMPPAAPIDSNGENAGVLPARRPIETPKPIPALTGDRDHRPPSGDPEQ